MMIVTVGSSATGSGSGVLLILVVVIVAAVTVTYHETIDSSPINSNHCHQQLFLP